MLLKIYEVEKGHRKLKYVVNSDNLNLAKLDKALCSCVRQENITRCFRYDKTNKVKRPKRTKK